MCDDRPFGRNSFQLERLSHWDSKFSLLHMMILERLGWIYHHHHQIISYHIIISPCVINYHFSIIMIRIISNEHGTGCSKQYVQLQGPRVQKPMIFPCFRGFPIATCLIPIAWAAMFHQSDVTSPGVVRMEGPPEELICATTHLTLFSAILRQLECLNVQAGETKTRWKRHWEVWSYFNNIIIVYLSIYLFICIYDTVYIYIYIHAYVYMEYLWDF